MSETPSISKHILLIDDDHFLLDMYALKFSKAGYVVQTCDGTAKALELIHGGYTPDIILCDIVMPGMDGLAFVEVVRAEHLVSKAIVIMLTNQGLSDDVARAKKLGVDGYIVKATTIPSEVLSEVEKISASKKA